MKHRSTSTNAVPPTSRPSRVQKRRSERIVSTDILPMEAQLVIRLPEGDEWRYEPKWDGFRCLAYKRDADVTLHSKSGKPLGRYFPDIVSVLAKLAATHFVLDGELLIEGEQGYSFPDLQMRLHPATSRITKLVSKQPATLMLFDILESEADATVMAAPFAQRRVRLEAFYHRYCRKEPALKLSPQTASIAEAMTWLNSTAWSVDGIVAKHIVQAYAPGERVMQKYKPLRTADCVVGGFRYGSDARDVGSLLLGLYDEDGRLNHVGFTSSIAKADKPALTKRLEQLIREPGFDGKAPGAPSRWSTERSAQWMPLLPDIVVEVSFDHVTGDRFRHGTTLLRFRPDKSPRQCTMDQLRS